MVYILGLLFLSIMVSWTDIKYRKIPNPHVIFILLLTSLLSISLGYFTQTVGIAVLVLIAAMLLWRKGFIGGGDVKLLAVFSLGVNPQYQLLVLLLMTCFTFVQLVIASISCRAERCRFSLDKGIPLGIPISFSYWLGCVLSVLSA
ncbi:prepilin peptidase [Vibrio hepatarius]|uniref:prepilin peptidase n=1 Tax=Vibrio hepatarius TaxID=171383 RepID=UPI00142E3DF0|nr:prepilin peptidase [Vibrio hepatarius]